MALINSGELEGISTDELLQAQAHVWNHMFAFEKSMCLNCAIELNIPDIIHKHGKPMSLSLLAKALKLDEAKTLCLSRIMRMLVHSKFFAKTTMISSQQNGKEEEEEEELYSITPASCFLLKDEPMSVSPLFALVLDPVITKPFHHVSEWLVGDKAYPHHNLSPFETAHGESFWGLLSSKDSRLTRLFNEGMECDSSLVSRVLINSFRECFEGIESLVDVGGGTGKIAKAIADAFPNVSCTVLELPRVVDGLESGNGSCNENLRFVAGDMFEMIPSADVLLLKWILHDWDDEDCVKILKKCKDALLFNNNNNNKRVGGRLIIIDMILNTYKSGDDVAYEDQLYFDMAMMAYLNGKERTEKEWAKLFFDAGFADYKVVPGAFGTRSLIQVYAI